MPDLSESVDQLSIQRNTLLHQTVYLDPDDSAPNYIGWGAPGTATNEAKWKIARLSRNGSGNVTKIEWADGNILYDNIYDNRAGLPYA